MPCVVSDDGRHSESPRIRKGLCDRHYMRAARRAKPKSKKPVKLCAHEDCGVRVKARELCAKHYKAKRRRERGVPELHNLTGYIVRKCKCEICSEAHRKYRAKKKKELRAKTAREGWHGKHGTDYAYNTAGCRCDICMTWRFGEAPPESPKYPMLVQDEGRGTTVVHWVPAGDGIWTCPHCALEIERVVPSETPRRDVAA